MSKGPKVTDMGKNLTKYFKIYPTKNHLAWIPEKIQLSKERSQLSKYLLGFSLKEQDIVFVLLQTHRKI